MDERDPMNLRELPRTHPPEGLWDSIAERLDEPPQVRRRWPDLAAAAALGVLAVSLSLVQGPGTAPGIAPGSATDLRDWWALSDALETRLETLQTGGVMDADALGRVSNLESRLDRVDARLAASPRDPELWAKRVQLLDELNNAYAGQVWLAQMDMTSI